MPGSRTADVPAGRMRTDRRSPARRRDFDLTLAVAALAYAAAVVFLSWPLVTVLPSSVVDPVALAQLGAPWLRADLDLLIWILAWTSHALVEQPLALFQANVFYPAPDTLAASEHLIGLTPVAAPVFTLTGNAVLTYNATVLAVVWLAAISTFVLARAFSGSAAAAFVAGAAFAFAPDVTGTWTRLHVSAVSLFPLVLLLAWRGVRAPRARVLVALFVVTALQVLAGMYVAYELAALLAAFAPALVVEARRQERSPLPVLLALAAAFLVIVPVGLPYLRMRASGDLPSFEEARALVASNSIALPQVLRSIGDQLTWPVVALALLGLAWPARARLVERLGLASIALVGLVLSAGLSIPLLPGTSLPGPYEILMRVVPGFASMRAPARFLVLTLLALSVLAALGVVQLAGLLRGRAVARRATPWLMVAAAGLGLIVVRAPGRALPVVRVGLDGPQLRAHRWLRDYATTPGPVLELPVYNAPMDGGLMRVTANAMVGSTLHWFPLLNGYSGHPPASARLLMTLAQRLPDARAFDELCRLVDLRWIVVHFALLPGQEEIWAREASKLGLTLADRFGSDAIYRVDRSCGVDERLARPHRGTPHETLGGVALVPLDARDRHGVLSTDDVPSEQTTGTHRWFWIDVRNDGASPWPGLSATPTHAVALQARWRDAATGRLVYEEFPVPLARDLAPGESVRAQVNSLVPRAGDYVFEIGLLQDGVGWFVEHGGSGVLRIPVRVRALGDGSPR